MAKPTTDKSKNALPATQPEYPLTTMAVVAPLVGWLIPGGGHILLKRYGRGILLLVSVVAMFLIGLGMQGRIYKPNGGDILDILGFVGDVGSGALYFLARIMDWGNVMAANAAADYGKTFLIVAGLLNFIEAADAHHIALGKKPWPSTCRTSRPRWCSRCSHRWSSASHSAIRRWSRCATASTASPYSWVEFSWRDG